MEDQTVSYGTIVRVCLHRGGGYTRSSSIYEGGGLTEKTGVVVWRGHQDANGNRISYEESYRLQKKQTEAILAWGSLYIKGEPCGPRPPEHSFFGPGLVHEGRGVCEAMFFDGDSQVLSGRYDQEPGFPVKSVAHVRSATDDEIAQAETIHGFRSRPKPLPPLPGENA